MASAQQGILADALFDDWIGNREVLTSTTVPVQLPDIRIPAGTTLFFLASPDNTSNIYFHKTRPLVTSAARRLTLTPGEGRTFAVTNAHMFWFLPITANDAVEWMVEWGNRVTQGVIAPAPAQTNGTPPPLAPSDATAEELGTVAGLRIASRMLSQPGNGARR